MRIGETAGVVLGLLALCACSKTVQVADGPIVLDAEEREIVFLASQASAPSLELCLEFETPDESRGASGIHVSLVRTDGGREVFVPTEIDRRGEALVCLCRKRAPGSESGGGKREGEAAGYRAAFLSSKTHLRLRQVRWWSGPAQTR